MFQNSIIQNQIKTIPSELIENNWGKFQKFFLNEDIQNKIRKTKEESFQTQFLENLFIECLGYIIHPHHNYNLETEKKNERGGKKSDGAIIFNNEVRCVIELKGMNTTDLGGKVEIQAFSYLNNHKNCVYVITSNFQKLRFYIQNATDFVEYNLFDLSFESFQELYTLLSKESLEKDIPLLLQSKSISKEEEITKEFYKNYSLFKTELFKNLIEKNPQFEKLSLFKKSQKLIDRFLFLFFAEDRNLLPPNSVRLILDDWEDLKDKDVYIPLYDRFKKYFEYMNKGYKGKRYDVFPYNGGLFRDDDLLDKCEIDDELLFLHSKKLSEYDFQVEVDVDVLGKIFENSLNEIDDITNQIENGEKEFDFTSKRKKDGVFYTPNYITNYIIQNSLGRLCKEKKDVIGLNELDYTTDKNIQKKTKETLLNKIELYRNWLLNLSILDPSCGSGAFLNETLNFLIEEHNRIDELENQIYQSPIRFSSIETTILENNIFGVDINQESVEIAKLSLWLRTAQPNRKLNDLSNNLKCGNSLVNSDEVENRFDWGKEFPKVFEKGGFDIIVGNPPYIKESVNKRAFNNLHSHPIYQGKMDLWYFFGYLGLELTKRDKSYIGFIAPNNWITNDGASKFRNYFLENGKLVDYVDFGDFKVFEDAGIQTMIYIMKSSNENSNYTFPYSKLLYGKSSSNDVKLFLNKSINKRFEFFNTNINKDEFYGGYIHFHNQSVSDLLNKISKKYDTKIKNTEVYSGIDIGQDFVNKKSKEKLGDSVKIGDGVFNLSNTEKEKLNLNQNEIELVKPFYTPKQINRYVSNKNNLLWVIYTTSKYKNSNLLGNLPNIKSHLDKFQSVITSANKPYGLHRSRDEEVFLGNKILSIRKCKTPSFSFVDFDCYVNRTFNIIQTDRLNLKFLTCLFNSKLIKFWLLHKGKLQGNIYQVDMEPITSIPIKVPNDSKVYEEFYDTISKSIIELNELEDNTTNTIYSRLSIENKLKKIDGFDFNSYEEFISILKGYKKNLPSISEDGEWRKFINSSIQKRKEKKSLIETIEMKIDEKILNLYEINEDELVN
ncbi:Eco57I restriction-modification methylase domain-containing protein [Flavobacteriaceae bacterium]|nr:Eco57I restriction-modification methylase domain-containing protein [Flavobacteriaceae bacterium]